MKERLIVVYCSQPPIPCVQSPPEKWHLTQGNKLTQNRRKPKSVRWKTVKEATSMADRSMANKEDAWIRFGKGGRALCGEGERQVQFYDSMFIHHSM